MTAPRLTPLARRVATGAAALTIVVIATALIAGIRADDRSVVPPLVVAQSPGSESYTTRLSLVKPLVVACPGWSGTVNGADGARVEISACPDPDRPPLDIGPERTLFFRVRMENIGTIRTPAGFAPGTGLRDSLGQVYLADLSRSLPVDPAIAGDPQLDPGEQADLALVVPIRRETVPLQLSVVHPTSRLSIVDWSFSP